MDDHLGRDIRHDDLYEELAPITHCDFNKKVHAHSDQLSKKTYVSSFFIGIYSVLGIF